MNPKIVTLARLASILKRSPRKKTVFTNGCFDILHYGHVKYLREAKSKGDILIVGLNSDRSTQRLKGKNRPINTQKDRAFVLASLESVDYVVVFDEETPYRLIRSIEPDVLVKGGDWPRQKIVGADVVLARGGRVLTIPYVKNRSTTDLIRRIIRKTKT